MPSPRLGTDPNPGQCRAIVGQARPPEISSLAIPTRCYASEASPSPAIAKIISNLGSPFGSLTIISSSEKQWAQ